MKCPNCSGTGTVMEWDEELQTFTEFVCFLCNGMGTHPYGGQ